MVYVDYKEEYKKGYHIERYKEKWNREEQKKSLDDFSGELLAHHCA